MWSDSTLGTLPENVRVESDSAPQMYSWLVSPEALNPGYRHWILQASGVPASVLPWVVVSPLSTQHKTEVMLLMLSSYQARHRTPWEQPPLETAYQTLTRRDISPIMAQRVDQIIENVQHGDYGPEFPPWSVLTSIRLRRMYLLIQILSIALSCIPGTSPVFEQSSSASRMSLSSSAPYTQPYTLFHHSSSSVSSS